ncbi:mycofactocin biosynthesis glycosyltransferase MftF [Amycolatopsis sp.]|uniref:mycofactocin biosynthesis glycosyltransferase MftF n=1 Tax=Amycolatopsis sp. TaxID=37632 RepID=UPI002D0305F5|nr:mycofactocin biosynthesis glycosyltransferase MftF [Amycolatopsis sp.]HVV10214.1 mycofactocin biosynthesis glycosyltransferase MftF [Amycolatopsis sp.]
MRLRIDPGTRMLGRTLIGGAPLRVLRLSEAGARLFRQWENGDEVHSGGQLADKIIAAGIAHPVYERGTLTPADVTIVVPARDPAGPLPVGALVVDDGSVEPIPHAAQRHQVARGPAAARNTGWWLADTRLVAFLDADTRPAPGWLENLLPQFEDPAVVAVAPRVRSAKGSTKLARYERARSSLDLGDKPAQVGRGGRVTYVPTAALVVRVEALREIGGFDEDLRFGEDVDLVWRLVDAGGRVRYEPAAEVVHEPRSSWRAWAKQRFDYGTSAAPLSRRHGRKALAPLRISGWTALAWSLVALGKPKLGLMVALVTAGLLPRKLRPMGVPDGESLKLALRGHLGAGRYVADLLTRTWGPVAIPLLAATRRGRWTLALALSRHVREWAEVKPEVDLGTWIAARAADDLSYGAGVWRGCVTERTVAPLVPDLSDWPGK